MVQMRLWGAEPPRHDLPAGHDYPLQQNLLREPQEEAEQSRVMRGKQKQTHNHPKSKT